MTLEGRIRLLRWLRALLWAAMVVLLASALTRHSCAQTALHFVPIAPCSIVDTRTAATTSLAAASAPDFDEYCGGKLVTGRRAANPLFRAELEADAARPKAA